MQNVADPDFAGDPLGNRRAETTALVPLALSAVTRRTHLSESEL